MRLQREGDEVGKRLPARLNHDEYMYFCGLWDALQLSIDILKEEANKLYKDELGEDDDRDEK